MWAFGPWRKAQFLLVAADLLVPSLCWFCWCRWLLFVVSPNSSCICGFAGWKFSVQYCIPAYIRQISGKCHVLSNHILVLHMSYICKCHVHIFTVQKYLMHGWFGLWLLLSSQGARRPFYGERKEADLVILRRMSWVLNMVQGPHGRLNYFGWVWLGFIMFTYVYILCSWLFKTCPHSCHSTVFLLFCPWWQWCGSKTTTEETAQHSLQNADVILSRHVFTRHYHLLVGLKFKHQKMGGNGTSGKRPLTRSVWCNACLTRRRVPGGGFVWLSFV